MDTKTLSDIQGTLKSVSDQITVLKTDLDNARKAGVDVTEQTKNYNDLKARYQRMLSVYGSK